MTADELLFFEQTPKAYPLYDTLRREVLRLYPKATVTVQKTQITFRDPGVFLCVSKLPGARKNKAEGALNVTFGLPGPLCSPRVFSSAKISPGRWTHHLLLKDPLGIDAELLSYLTVSHGMVKG